ncbi:MAG: phosphate signaling complex protein PhoU [Verrucomicrobiota bacterium]|jgi:phosphate transport system protein
MDKSINELREKILLMANLTRQNLDRAVQSLIHRDLDLARMVIGDDTDIDDLEVKIDQLGMDILVRFHPVATDLRLVVTSMKTAHNLERISDHAVNIAKRTKKICKSGESLETNMIEPLYAMAIQIFNDAMLSFTDREANLGEGLKAVDDELDTAHKEVAAKLSRRLEDSKLNAENILHLILVARSIERIGDLAVNIGEDSVFLREARDIRHTRQ